MLEKHVLSIWEVEGLPKITATTTRVIPKAQSYILYGIMM